MSKRTAFLSYEQSELDGLSRRPWTLAVQTDFITLLYRLYLYLLLFQEDNLLRRLVEEDRVVKWCDVSAHFSGRTGKQCSERSAARCSSALQSLKITPRYHHHLSPDVVKDPWTAEEDMALAYAQNKIGNQWKQM